MNNFKLVELEARHAEIKRSQEEEELMWRRKEREYQEQIIQALAFIKDHNLRHSYTNFVESNDFQSMKDIYESASPCIKTDKTDR